MNREDTINQCIFLIKDYFKDCIDKDKGNVDDVLLFNSELCKKLARFRDE